MTNVDYYAILQVHKRDDRATIKTAYRRLAREYHPDQNPGDPAAEEHFKEIVTAWQVLGDPVRRRQYDVFGHRVPFGAGHETPVPAEPKVVWKAFRKTAKSTFQRQFLRRKGKDLSISVTLSFREYLLGTTRVFEIPRRDRRGRIVRRRFEVNVPAGVESGRILRWKGYGAPGPHEGPYGDLRVGIRVESHPIFRVVHDRLVVDVYPDRAQLRDGAVIDVPTPWGPRRVEIASDTVDQTRIKLRRGGGLNKNRERNPLWVQIHGLAPDASESAVDAFKNAQQERARYLQQLRDEHGTSPRA